MVLDLVDFQADKGGDLKKLKESQRRRYAPESLIDDIVASFEDVKKSNRMPSTFRPDQLADEQDSEICFHANRFADQRDAEGDWAEEKGQCWSRNGAVPTADQTPRPRKTPRSC